MNQDLALTKADISALIARAQAGDNKAAVKLAFYFDFYERDYDSATFWFKKAARNGDVKSEYNLGVRLLMQSKDPEKCREATFWLKMALANGMSRARRSLEELGPCP